MIPNDLIIKYVDASILASSADKSGNWTLNLDKSSKTCATTGNCTFNVSFTRAFDAEASYDYSNTKNANALYEAFTFAAEYTTGSGSLDRSTLIYRVSESQ